MIRKVIYHIQKYMLAILIPVFLVGCGLPAAPSNSLLNSQVSSPTYNDKGNQSNNNSSTYVSSDIPAESSALVEDGLEGAYSSQPFSPNSSAGDASSSSEVSSSTPTHQIQTSSKEVLPVTPEPPIIKEAIFKKGIPDGFVLEQGAELPEGTMHIEVLIENATSQMYRFTLAMEDLPEPIIIKTYRSTSHPSQNGNNQVSLSQPFELTPEMLVALSSNPNARISLTIVGVYGKDNCSPPSEPLYLAADQEHFSPKK